MKRPHPSGPGILHTFTIRPEKGAHQSRQRQPGNRAHPLRPGPPPHPYRPDQKETQEKKHTVPSLRPSPAGLLSFVRRRGRRRSRRPGNDNGRQYDGRHLDERLVKNRGKRSRNVAGRRKNGGGPPGLPFQSIQKRLRQRGAHLARGCPTSARNAVGIIRRARFESV